ncbi:hypothetical protein C0557_24970 [Kosakonia sp. MUSA4]|nr:hypothetical protein C0557_24970 [Kosakonia sp. MUSA4]
MLRKTKRKSLLAISTDFKEVSENKAFETNFPDQPIKVKFKPIRQDALLTVIFYSEEKVVVNKNVFITEMPKYALSFFKSLSSFKGVDKNNYVYEMKILKRLIS